MTTDADEGRRQAEAMKPEPLKVGDKVQLAAGGERVMTVVALEDYGNRAVCEMLDGDGMRGIDTFSVRSLVKIEDGAAKQNRAEEPAEAPEQRPQEGHAEQGQG